MLNPKFYGNTQAASVQLASTRVPSAPVHIEGTRKRAAESSSKVITVCNQKGGVAKTTTCLNLGTSLAMMGKQVLLIDFDVQANLSSLLKSDHCDSFYDFIQSGESDLSSYIVKTGHDFWLLPANSRLSLLAKNHMREKHFEYMLKDQLAAIKNFFDYIIIDTPPSGDFYTLNALLASDIAAVPSQCEYLSMNGISHIRNMVDVIKAKANHKIDFHVLVTMFDRSNTASRVIFNKLNHDYYGSVFSTIIERDEIVQQSQILLTPTMAYDKNSRAGLQYFDLAKEIESLRCA
ncbi:MAG: ParA family protein [Gammaproteobacteria bacterium]|nr:ParA family protein [Gammaproteobacteria bacterium]MDH5800709.1 ParA family protein [Gammaproteobacteria bacterium]